MKNMKIKVELNDAYKNFTFDQDKLIWLPSRSTMNRMICRLPVRSLKI